MLWLEILRNLMTNYLGDNHAKISCDKLIIQSNAILLV
jgi:hypothetical protein